MVSDRKQIKAFPELRLYRRIRRQSSEARISMGNWLLIAAEEKLAREAARRNRPSQGEAEECEVA